jgi:hypothetical protein
LQQFIQITLPLLKPVTSFVVAVGVIGLFNFLTSLTSFLGVLAVLCGQALLVLPNLGSISANHPNSDIFDFESDRVAEFLPRHDCY